MPDITPTPPQPTALAPRQDAIQKITDALLCGLAAHVRSMERVDPAAAKSITAVLKDLAGLAALRPELDIREQDLRIAVMEQKLHGAEGQGNIRVTLDAGPEEWNQ